MMRLEVVVDCRELEEKKKKKKLSMYVVGEEEAGRKGKDRRDGQQRSTGG
jgi:hypothetical protein